MRYNDKKGEYKRRVQTTLKLANPLAAQKMRVEKPPERSPFPCLSPLYYRMHEIFPHIRGTFLYTMYTHTHIRANTLCTVHRSRPCLADHPHGYSNAESAVLPRRKVLNGEARLKKGSEGANASTSERTNGIISRSAKKLYFMIAVTFKPPTMRCVRLLVRAQLFHAF